MQFTVFQAQITNFTKTYVCGYPLRNVTNTNYNHISWVDIYLYINFSYKTWWDSPLISAASCKSIRKLTKFAPKNHLGACNFSFIISQFTLQQYLPSAQLNMHSTRKSKLNMHLHNLEALVNRDISRDITTFPDHSNYSLDVRITSKPITWDGLTQHFVKTHHQGCGRGLSPETDNNYNKLIQSRSLQKTQQF